MLKLTQAQVMQMDPNTLVSRVSSLKNRTIDATTIGKLRWSTRIQSFTLMFDKPKFYINNRGDACIREGVRVQICG